VIKLSCRKPKLPAMFVACLLLVALVVAGCGGSGSSATTEGSTAPTEGSTPATGSGGSEAASAAAELSAAAVPGPNGTPYNERVTKSSITSSNIDQLGVAWTIPIASVSPAGGAFASPVAEKGIVYLQEATANIIAVEMATGKVVWKRESHGTGAQPSGLALAEGHLYGATASNAFALDPASGKTIWESKALAGEAQLNGAPQVADGKVFLSTGLAEGHGGRLMALDAKTGKKLWQFNTTVEDHGEHLSGGAWNAPGVGPDGTAYYGIGNPYQSAEEAIKNPTKFLYNDSTVALDPDSGALKWYYQGITDDFHDWDMQLSPIYVPEGANGDPTVLDSGKMGIVYAMDAKTGKLDWKTPLGSRNGTDEDSRLAFEHKLHINAKEPYVYEPGTYGGVENNMAYDEGVVYAAVDDMPSILDLAVGLNGATFNYANGTGEMVALDVKTGKVLWDTKLTESSEMPIGMATVSNDLVYTTTLNGYVVAFDRETGEEVWRKGLPAHTNFPVVPVGNMLITAGSYPQVEGEKSEFVAYQLGAKGSTPGPGKFSTESTSSLSPEGSQILKIESTGASYLPAKFSAKPGKVTFKFKSAGGEAMDNVTVADSSGKVVGATGTVGSEPVPGNTLTLNLKPGKYTLYSTVPGLRQAGEEGTLVVGGGGSEKAAGGGGQASAAAGKEVFTTNCAVCHTLAAAGSTGTTGPNLDQLMPSDALVQHQVTNGGQGMPAFGSVLSKSEIEAVANFVSSEAGKK
jgi:outer membrane protein assembly factor BamB